MRRPILMALAVLAATTAPTVSRAGGDNRIARARADLSATVDPVARRIAGTVRWVIPNTSLHPLGQVSLWLYPNRLGDRPEALGDVNFHWLYPKGFSAASLRIDAARVGPAGVPVAIESSSSGRATIARVTLPVPIPPGGDIRVDVDFTTELPVRLGGFGCTATQCRLMGGFYPFPFHLGPGGWQAEAPPDRIDYAAQISAPTGTDVLLGDVYAHAAGPAITGTGINVPYITLVTDHDLGADDIVVGSVRARFLHRGTRPPSSEGEVLPYVREDRAGLVLDATRRALAFVSELGIDPTDKGTGPPLTLIEAPLRHELVQVHGNVILVSDRLFGIFPVERLRKFHRLELIRAVLNASVGQVLRQIEPDPDVDLSTEVMASFLTEAFTLREFRRIEFARDLLRPLSFIPAVDQLMYAPLVASSASYFGVLDDHDVVRDDVRRFSHQRAGGGLIYSKLVDLLGAPGMNRVGRTLLGQRVPLRQAAAREFAGDLDWFWRQWWDGPPPRVNYNLAAVRAVPLPQAGVHVAIDIVRQGTDLLEPVEVRVIDRAGVAHDLVWKERGAGHRFDLDLPAGLASVEIDPRHRLVESALGSLDASDDPLSDNRDPKKWRLIYSGFGGLLDVTSLTASFAALVTAKPRHDLRNSLSFLAYHSPSTNIGLETAYTRLFGRQADRNRLTSGLSVGLSGSLLNTSFGVGSLETVHPKWRLSGQLLMEHDDRDYFIDPWSAIGVTAGVHYAVTGLEGGERLAQFGGGIDLLRLFELFPGHVLALDVQGGATFGDIRVRSQLGQIGGATGLRGYAPDELFGRGRAVGRIELRDRYVSDLDWNLAHFTSVRGLGGNLFFETGLVTSCDDLSVGQNDVFYDAGYSFRVLHDAFGVYQQMLSIDLAVPLNRHDRVCMGQHSVGPPDAPQLQIPRPRFVVLISFLPNF